MKKPLFSRPNAQISAGQRLSQIASELKTLGYDKTANKIAKAMQKLAAVGKATWDDDTCEYDEAKYEENHELAQLIAKELHMLSSSREQRQWNRRDNYQYDDRDDYDRHNSSGGQDASQRFQDLQREAKRKQAEAYEESLHEQLRELCFRLERPYEHHNEMESYYAYQERDRGDEWDY
jgi:hypothetical protein